MKKLALAKFEHDGKIFVSFIELRKMLELSERNFLQSFWSTPTIYWWSGYDLKPSLVGMNHIPEQLFFLESDVADILLRHQGQLTCPAELVPLRFAEKFPLAIWAQRFQAEVEFREEGWYAGSPLGHGPHILVSTLKEEAFAVCEQLQMTMPVYAGRGNLDELARAIDPTKYEE